MLQELGRGRDADKELELGIGGAEPEERDEEREDDGAGGIDVPDDLTAEHAGHDAKAVDEEIVAVIFPQNPNLRVLLSQRPAVQKEGQLCCEGDGDGDDRREMEVSDAGLVSTFGERARRHHDDDEGDSAHEEAEDDVARRLDARLAGREATRIDAVDGATCEDECEIGQRIEDGVGHCGEDRQRA